MFGTIAVDFDGVLHAYSKKWSDGTIYDNPIPGSREAMQTLLDKGYEVVIYSTRGETRTVKNVEQPHQRHDMKIWLDKHQIPYTRIHDEPGKPLCKLFIDDNAYRFTGDWVKCINDIEELGF